MLLTISTTHQPATDLGYLVHKNPIRFQSFALPFGSADVFYPEAEHDRCTVALLLNIDPVGLARPKHIRTEHFLLGIVQEADCVAARLFSRMGVELDTVRFAIESVVGGSEDPHWGDLDLTPAVKNAIVAALEECRLSDDPFIGIEQLLIGIMRDEKMWLRTC